MNFNDFAAGAATGSWLTIGGYALGLWLRRREQRRLNVAQAKAMAAAITKLFGQAGGPDCPCDDCAARRKAAEANAARGGAN